MTAPLEISGLTAAGDLAETVVLTAADGMTASILTLGARLLDLTLADGRSPVLTLGDSIADVEADTSSVNAAIGRVANRIRAGKVDLYPRMYDRTLELNDRDACGNEVNHLHGGSNSWSNRLFAVKHKSETSVTLARTSPDGEQRHPSDVDVSITYALTGDGGLAVRFSTTNSGTRDTQTNMTLHPYFDLSGRNGTVCDSVVPYVLHAPACTKYLALDETNAPTGEVADVKGTRFDFTTARALGEEGEEFTGYDQYLVSREGATDADAAEQCLLSVSAPGGAWGAGVRLDVLTNQPGLQIYTAGHMDGSGAQGFAKHGSLAIEPSEFVDAGNHKNFPQVVLKPGQERVQTITYKFATL